MEFKFITLLRINGTKFVMGTFGEFRRNPISYIGIVCGVFLLFTAFFAANHAVTEQVGGSLWVYNRTTYPYSQCSFPLAIVGILSLIIGIIFLSQKPTEFSGSS